MSDSKPSRTPMDIKLKIDMEGEPLNTITYYQRLVGKLIYVTITRLDIIYAISIVSQFMHSPTLAHLNVVKRILLYLKGSIRRGIFMTKNGYTHIWDTPTLIGLGMLLIVDLPLVIVPSLEAISSLGKAKKKMSLLGLALK